MLTLLVLLPIVVIIWQWRRLRFSGIVVLRFIIIALLVLAMADPSIGADPPKADPLVLLVDQSDSLTPAGKQALRERAQQLVDLHMASVQEQQEDTPIQPIITYWFGDSIATPGQAPPPDSPPPMLLETLEPSGSNIADALRTARELLTPTGGDIVLLSDGIETSGNALQETARLAETGITVDTWHLPIESDWTPEVRITRVEVAPSLRQGDPYAVQITVDRTDPDNAQLTPATLELWISTPDDEGRERLLGRDQVELTTGANHFSFDDEATTSGLIKLRASIKNVPDTFEQNNDAVATTTVKPPPRILIVEGEAGNGGDLSSAIWQTIESDTISPQQLPNRLSQLQRFDGMVLLDVSAYNLTLDQMTTIREFVRSEGRGLVVAGGRNAYSLGAYEDTPLEEVLPIDLEPPPRNDRTNVAMLLIIDRSASMSIPIEVSKLDMAKEAAILSTEMLQSEDSIGILVFDTNQEWVVPFQQVGDGLTLKQIQDAIVMLGIGGGTNIYEALEAGIVALLQQEASVRHAVVLTDGRSFSNDMDAYENIVSTARNNDITLSTIAIGIDSDLDLLEQLAEWGDGRYYYADKPEDIPRLTIQESEIARADPVVEGNFHALLNKPHAVVRDTSIADLPPFTGYIATTSRPDDQAEVVLEAPSGETEGTNTNDPILATWNYGLGRVVAWTPSIAQPWATDWTTWQNFAPFWTQVIRYTLPEPDSGPLQVHMEPLPNGVQMTVDGYEAGGSPLLADAVARVTLPGGSRREFALHQTAPGHYAQELVLSAAGAYGVEVLLQRDGEQYYVETGYAHPPSREYTPLLPYAPPGQQTSSYPQGAALLQTIAEQTGGKVLDEQTLAEQQETVEHIQQEQSPVGATLTMLRHNLWLLLLSLALVLWIIEIAFRRRGTV
jgi:Mg-chelatase subunit ChlD